jgi:hypothetical protein
LFDFREKSHKEITCLVRYFEERNCIATVLHAKSLTELRFVIDTCRINFGKSDRSCPPVNPDSVNPHVH